MTKKGDFVGNKNPNWKSGRRKNIAGYIQVKSYYHPLKSSDGYVMEHRIIMEQWLREHDPNHHALIEIDDIKYLRKEWIPHHIDGKKDNNCIENLELMSAFKHKSFHNKGKTSNKKGNTWEEMYGKKQAEEMKRKLSLARIGIHLSKETCKKISEVKKGISCSEETKKKLSLALKKHYVGGIL